MLSDRSRAAPNADAISNVYSRTNVGTAANVAAPRKVRAAPEIIPRLNVVPPAKIGARRRSVALGTNILARETL
jgi:hypothetical protein